jgi:hypothetical protein
MIRAHFTLPCLYLAQKKIVDRLNIPSLVKRSFYLLNSIQLMSFLHQQLKSTWTIYKLHQFRDFFYKINQTMLFQLLEYKRRATILHMKKRGSME